MFPECSLKVRFNAGEHACNKLNAQKGVMNLTVNRENFFHHRVGINISSAWKFVCFVFYHREPVHRLGAHIRTNRTVVPYIVRFSLGHPTRI